MGGNQEGGEAGSGARRGGSQKAVSDQQLRSQSLGYGTFLLEYVKKPSVVGAIAPSSNSLARRMVEWLDLEHATVVVEYGPGTGAFTQAILEGKARQCTYLGIEINPVLGVMFRKRFPELKLYEASVKDVKRICDTEGITEIDCIVSGLPWASFSTASQKAYLDAMMTVLRKDGQFVTFAYLQGLILPAGVRFRKRLRDYFREISRSKTVWKNLPPAFVYRCRR